MNEIPRLNTLDEGKTSSITCMPRMQVAVKGCEGRGWEYSRVWLDEKSSGDKREFARVLT